MTRRGSALSSLCLALLCAVGCLKPSLPPPPPEVELGPGRFVQEYYAAPDFQPTAGRYHLAPVQVETVAGAEAEAVRRLFQTETAQAFTANGLTVHPTPAEFEVSLVLHRLEVSRAFRWLRGRIAASLSLSGTISRGGRPVFAFRDALRLTSPLAPGPADPQEARLLLRQLFREAARRLVNQMLL
ncbi:MAG: hypothetical protein K6T55_05280 [Syntrophobacterales bacterium]|nr:hypothetical protein [Syntrophobacterales bacterium]